MRSHVLANRRLLLIVLCVGLIGAGCGPILAGPSAADLSMVLIGAFLPHETCVVWLTAWRLEAGEREDLDGACRDLDDIGQGDRLPDGFLAQSVGGAGAFVIDTVQINGSVAGSQLPRWTAVISAAPEVPGGASVTASVSATDDEGNPAATVPAKIQATLYDVDRKGKRKKVGRKTAKFDKKTGGAGAIFTGLSGARDHYELDVVVKGKNVKDGSVSYAAATASGSSARIRSVFGAWLEEGQSRVGATPVTTWAGVVVASVGKTAAGRLPSATIVVDLEQANRNAERSVKFDVFGLAMQGDADLNPAKQQVKKIQFTLYAVDAKGKRTKIATKTGKVVKANGVALVSMEGVAAPASHYEIDAKAIGGKMQDSRLSLSALVAPAGLAGRVLSSGSIAGVRVLPRVERAGPPKTSSE